MQTQITPRRVIEEETEEETEELDEKPLRRPPSGNRSTSNQLGYKGEEETLQA